MILRAMQFAYFDCVCWLKNNHRHKDTNLSLFLGGYEFNPVENIAPSSPAHKTVLATKDDESNTTSHSNYSIRLARNR